MSLQLKIKQSLGDSIVDHLEPLVKDVAVQVNLLLNDVAVQVESASIDISVQTCRAFG